VLKKDCIDAFEQSDIIAIFVSYRDIEELKQIAKENEEIRISIVNLTFSNIEMGVAERIKKRGTNSTDDIIKRIKIAIELNQKYKKALERLVDITILTDICDIEETYQTAARSLNLNNGRNENEESR